MKFLTSTTLACGSCRWIELSELDAEMAAKLHLLLTSRSESAIHP